MILSAMFWVIYYKHNVRVKKQEKGKMNPMSASISTLQFILYTDITTFETERNKNAMWQFEKNITLLFIMNYVPCMCTLYMRSVCIYEYLCVQVQVLCDWPCQHQRVPEHSAINAYKPGLLDRAVQQSENESSQSS